MHRKILKVLKDDEMKFQTAFIKENLFGVNEGDSITINLLQCLVPTVVHECLHELYPELSERKILTLEEVVYSRLTFGQKRSIFKLFMRRVIENEKEKKWQSEEGRIYNKTPSSTKK